MADVFAAAGLAASLATGFTPGPLAGGATPATAFSALVGQKLMVAMSGTTPSADLLGRIRRGEIGGVILFAENITTPAGLTALTRSLQAAAAGGGQPPLLIATDQEGGTVRRVSWAPPSMSPPAMGNLGSVATAEAQGLATGRALACAGINDNLAPVADVPASTASFMYQDGRTWSFSASTTASLSSAFARGLEAGGSLPTMKHFPGIGLATKNTDSSVVTIAASKATLAPGLLPYQQAIADGSPMVMLSNATYSAYDSVNGAGWSHAISVGLLRESLGFQGVSITDSLSGTARARGVSGASLAIKAARAGTDMIMLTGSEAASKGAYASLLNAATSGSIPLATLQASYNRILALKAGLPAPVADSTAPVVAAPASFIGGGTLGSTTVPVRVSWTASDPCRIAGYAVQRRVDGGAWAGVALASPRSTSATQSLAFGDTYEYGARATDGAGNTSAWQYGTAFEPLRTEQTSGSIAWSGSWATGTLADNSGGSTRYASAAGAAATFTFTGRSVGWVAAVGPTRGSARVYVDGVLRSTVSLYASTTAYRRVVFTTSWPSQGIHTVRIVVLGTAGHPRVDVDAFVRLLRVG